jgi:tripartite-type tricarboxylate transporter receptor subunit TctC
LIPKRLPFAPDAPSILEKGYEYAVVSGPTWTVPIGTPKDIQRKLERALLQSFQDPTVIETINKFNTVFDPIDSESLTKIIAKEYKINGELLKRFGLGIYKK